MSWTALRLLAFKVDPDITGKVVSVYSDAEISMNYTYIHRRFERPASVATLTKLTILDKG